MPTFFYLHFFTTSLLTFFSAEIDEHFCHHAQMPILFPRRETILAFICLLHAVAWESTFFCSICPCVPLFKRLFGHEFQEYERVSCCYAHFKGLFCWWAFALSPMRGVRWNAHRSSFFSLLQKVKHFLLFVFSFLQRAIWHSAFWWALCTFYVCLFPYHFRTTDTQPVLRCACGHCCWNADEHFSHYTLIAQSSAWFGMLKDHFLKEGNAIFFCSLLDDINLSICILEKNLHAFFQPS